MKNVLKTGGLMLIVMTSILFGADGGIWEWVGQSWKLILGVLGVIAGGFYVPGVRTLLFIALKAAISGPVLKKLAVAAAWKYAKSTETEVDDEWVKEFERRISKVKGI